MRSVLFDIAGDPLDVLRFGDSPMPVIQDGQARVAVTCRPIQPADLAFIRGQYRVQPIFPQIGGLEAAGIVTEAPEGSGFAAGDRVAFRWPGSWAEQASVPLDRLIAVPADIGDDDACQMALNPLTAWGLLAEAGPRRDEAVIVTAATSTVAQLVAGLCRMRGIRTIGIVRGDAATAEPRCSADVVLAEDEVDLTERVKAAADGRPIAALLDSVGGPLLGTLIPALDAGARILAYGVMDPAPMPVTNAMLIYANLRWIGFGIDRWLAGLTAMERTGMMADLWGALRLGELTLPIAGRFALEDVADAVRADRQPGRIGKILLI